MLGFIQDAGTAFMFLARYLADGTLDITFGNSGTIIFYSNSIWPAAITICDNNRFAITGNYYDSNTGINDVVVMRFLPGGQTDVSFGDNGMRLVDLNASSLDTPGSISWNSSDLKLTISAQALKNVSMSDAVALIRLDNNGDLDAGFGINGVALFDGFNIFTSFINYPTTKHT